MTNVELDRLEALAGAATAGPWVADDGWEGRDGFFYISQPRPFGDLVCSPDSTMSEADARLCAEAREALPRLVAEVRRLTRERDEAMAIASKWETVGPL